MFENRQDTTLLRDSLLSSDNFLRSRKDLNEHFTDDDKQEAAKIVASTISSLTCNLYGVESVQELFRKQLEINRRCHATVFINLLKSQNFVSPEADSYYQSVLCNVSYFDWSFYLKLNFLCHWSEYFVECAQQLHPDTLAILLTKLLEIECDGEIMYYTWHLVLQSFICKSFSLQSPLLFKPSDCCLFQFTFSMPETLPEVNTIDKYTLKNNIIGHLPQIYNANVKKISEKISYEEININCIKVLFHGLKTLFRLVNVISDCECPCMEKFNQLSPLFASCLLEDKAQAVILKNLSENNYCTMDLCYQTMSWDINELYLIFLLENIWKDMTERPLNHLPNRSVPMTISNYCTEFVSFMKEKNLSYKSLVNLKDSYLNNANNSKMKYLQFLSNVVAYHYPYASRAAEYLLSDPASWKPYKICDLLEQNISILNPFEIHPALANAITKTDSEEHQRLLNIFYKILSSSSSLEIYDDALKHILNKWSLCQHFKLPEFHSLLTQFSRKTVSLKEAEVSLLPLFVQSPKVVLQSLIEQVLMQGADSMEMLHILKIIPVVCLHECNTEKVPLLISVISHYFELDLESQEAKHFLLLIKALMEVQATEDILSFDLFLEKCIFPNTSVNNISKLAYNLECLIISLDVLIHEHALEMNSEMFSGLVQHLGNIMSFCIETGFGQIKEIIIDVFILLSKYNRKPPCNEFLKAKQENNEDVQFNNYENIVDLYVLEIFTKETKSEKHIESNLLNWKRKIVETRCDLFWICCCFRNDTKLFTEKITSYDLTYINLLKCLTSLLWHFTKDEWLKSADLIEHYMSLLDSDEKRYSWLLTENDPVLYGVVRCLSDCFIIMVQEKSSENILNICGCFTNTIMSYLNEKTASSHLFLNVFLDVCHLVSLINIEELYNIFSSFLMSLLKKFLETCDKINEKDCFFLLKLGIDNLPNSVESGSLHNTIKYLVNKTGDDGK